MIQPSLIVQVGSADAPASSSASTSNAATSSSAARCWRSWATQVERAALAVARERADADRARSRPPSASRRWRSSDLQRARELMGEQFVSKAYVERAKAEAQVAGGKTVQAEERRRLSAREVALAQAQLSQRIVRSPIDGVVVDRYLAPGEYVEQKPLLRLAAIDPLRVDVLVPAVAFGRVQRRRPGHRGARTDRPQPADGRGQDRGPGHRCGQQHLPRAAGAAEPGPQAAGRAALHREPRASGGLSRPLRRSEPATARPTLKATRPEPAGDEH